MSFTKSGPSLVSPLLGTCSCEDIDRVGDTSPGLKEGIMLERGGLELSASLPNGISVLLRTCLRIKSWCSYLFLSMSPHHGLVVPLRPS